MEKVYIVEGQTISCDETITEIEGVHTTEEGARKGLREEIDSRCADIKDDLEDKFRNFANGFRRKSNIGMVYCLTNFNSTMEENLYRIYTLRDIGYDPYVMVYNKPNAPKEIKQLQRWCNNKIIFNSCKKFEEYKI